MKRLLLCVASATLLIGTQMVAQTVQQMLKAAKENLEIAIKNNDAEGIKQHGGVYISKLGNKQAKEAALSKVNSNLMLDGQDNVVLARPPVIPPQPQVKEKGGVPVNHNNAGGPVNADTNEGELNSNIASNLWNKLWGASAKQKPEEKSGAGKNAPKEGRFGIKSAIAAGLGAAGLGVGGVYLYKSGKGAQLVDWAKPYYNAGVEKGKDALNWTKSKLGSK